MLKRSSKLWALLLGFCVAELCGGPVSLNYKFQPEVPRSIKIGKKPVLTLVSGGKAAFEIVTPYPGTRVAQFAAKEAAELLSKACGVSIKPIPKPSGKVPAIIIGDPAAAVQAGIDLKKLDRDGFRIKTAGKNIILIGRDDPAKNPSSMYNRGDGGERASLFATYDFLERFAGIRFYYPGELGTYIPKLKEWQIPEIDIYDRPDLVQRSHYASWGPAARPAELGKPFNNQLFCLRMRVQSWTWPCCHGLEKLGLSVRFAKTHPEYFARNASGKTVQELGKGEHVCFSSPVREEIYKDAYAFLSGRPASERNIHPYGRNRKIVAWHNQQDPKVPVFDITPDDGYFPCRCERCSKLFTPPAGRNDDADRSLSNYMWRYYAQGAEKVKDLGYIAAWIYWPTLWQPDFELPKNILFVMCPRGPWSCGNETFFQKELERVRRWGKFTESRMRLWNYMIKYPHGIFRGIPSGAPRAVARYYKAVAPYICGVFSESGMERFMFQHLNLYVYYKVLWNTSLDVEALLDEYYRNMYGPAAPHMAAFDRLIEKLWLGMVGTSVKTPTGPKAVIPSDLEIWKNRYSDKRMAELESHLKAALKAVPADSIEAKRIRFFMREVWQPLSDAKKKFVAGQETHKSWKLLASEAAPAPVIDGNLNDAAWRKAKPYYLPRLGGKGLCEVLTSVKMLYDDKNIYFGIECEEPDTADMVIEKYPRDDDKRWDNSTAEIFLNPDGTRMNYYQLMIDAGGGLTDYRWDRGAADIKWNSGADVKCVITPGKKWTVEVRLPRSSMKGSEKIMPVNFMRHRVRANKPGEIYLWNPFMARNKETDKWGTAILGADPNPNVIVYGDFEAPVKSKRWIGPWYGDKVLELDRKNWIAGGAAPILRAGGNTGVTQRFKLKPGTAYEVSYFVKLENVGVKNSGGVRSRFDECGGNVTWLPKGFLRGTIPWTKVSQTITTDAKCGTKRKGPYTEYISIFLRPDAGGTAWIDHVEIREVRK